MCRAGKDAGRMCRPVDGASAGYAVASASKTGCNEPATGSNSSSDAWAGGESRMLGWLAGLFASVATREVGSVPSLRVHTALGVTPGRVIGGMGRVV